MTEKRYFALFGEDGYIYPVFFDSKKGDKEIEAEEVVDLLNKLSEENEQLKERNKKRLQRLKNQRKELKKQQEVIWGYKGDIKQLKKENKQLKERLDELKIYDKEEFAESEHINDIYKEKGFCGLIEYAKDKLQYYGVVKEVEKGLWVMVTGGWLDNEFWLHCLNNPVSMFRMKHYCGYLRGGAFYYTEKPRGDVEIILKGDVE